METKRFAGPLLAAAAMIVAMALLAPAAQATEPAKGYEAFAGCPSKEDIPIVNTTFCFTVEITGGHFQMGNKDVPIVNPIKISGGITNKNLVVANAKGGLVPTPQPVPGGILGITGLDWLVEFLELDALKLFATTELAGQPTNPLENPAVLPIRVHLENVVLGEKCYVGSFASPIVLNLTRGTTNPPPPNEPITGKEPTEEPDLTRKGVLLANDAVLVDNAFAAPKTNGCELILGEIHIGIDGLVSSLSGLPAAAGTNETVQESDAAVVSSKRVYP